jgi:dihydrofolate reductase
MIGIIAAVSSNGVIGVDGKLPWDYPADMKYFRTTTANSTIIFGRKTFESIGRKLPKRRNIVISSKKIEVEGVETFSSVADAWDQFDKEHRDARSWVEAPDMDMLYVPQNIWFAGGARIYEAGMDYAEEIHLTTVPDVIDRDDAVRFPFINPRKFEVKSWVQLTPGDDTLRLYVYKKI